MSQSSSPLQQLAAAYHIELSYHDDQGRLCEASPEALQYALQTLGAPLERLDRAQEVLRERRQTRWRQALEPVQVAWDGVASEIPLRLPSKQLAGTSRCHLELESGESRSWTCNLADLAVTGGEEIESVPYRVLRLPLPDLLPLGYHRLRVQVQGTDYEQLLISAPGRAYEPPDGMNGIWGVFLPVYAIRSERNWGCGDFTDLDNLIAWTQKVGGGLVGTLPLLTAFLDEPFEPSPYSPASRLFWNELYIDPTRLPEFGRCPAAAARVASPDFKTEVEGQRARELVDYKGMMALKRSILEPLAATFFADPGERLQEFRRFLDENPRVEEYARFRAATEQQKASWWQWPERLRNGQLQPGDYDDAVRRYHLYVQWAATEQVRGLSARASARGPGLYLDFPLGVNSDSYDVWRERDSFATRVSAGAPPDSFFTLGQDWGFPPLHPENIRRDGYRYLRDCLRHHMRSAGVLRIDHMMGLHRFFWVPATLGPRQGVYVRYPTEELYAVYGLESVRNQTVLVGEDLGTVPPEVRPTMERHNIRRLYVGQYEVHPIGTGPLGHPAPGSIASMNTHDMPTFTAFWEGLDLDDRQALGLIDAEGREAEALRRQYIRDSMYYFFRQRGLLDQDTSAAAVFRACLLYLASTKASVVLANLEDLWQATEPQNCPGTWRERPNWKRKAKYPLELLDTLPHVREVLEAVGRVLETRTAGKS